MKDSPGVENNQLQQNTSPSQWIDIGTWNEAEIDNNHNKLRIWAQREQQAPPGFEFPFSKNRRCSFSSLHLFPFLRYSVEKDAVVCLPCYLMNCNLKDVEISFVTKPFNNWKKLKEKAKAHESASRSFKKNLHKDNVLKLNSLIQVLSGSTNCIGAQLATEYEKQLKFNKYILIRYLHVIHFWGKQALAIRGKSDQRSNFLNLLQMEAASDEKLQKHLESTVNSKKSYLSHRIQNEFIQIIGDFISDSVVALIRKAPFWSLLADEGTDSSGKTLLGVFIRYIVEDSVDGTWEIKEDFICFAHAEQTTGEALQQVIYQICEKYGFDLNKLRGQGYGGGNMAGCNIGLQARIKRDFPLALFIHC